VFITLLMASSAAFWVLRCLDKFWLCEIFHLCNACVLYVLTAGYFVAAYMLIDVSDRKLCLPLLSIVAISHVSLASSCSGTLDVRETLMTVWDWCQHVPCSMITRGGHSSGRVRNLKVVRKKSVKMCSYMWSITASIVPVTKYARKEF